MNAHSNSPDSGNFNFEPIQHKRNVQTFHEKSGRCVSVRAAREQMSADPGVRRLFIATPKWADYHRPPPVHPRSSGDVIRVGGDLKPRPLRLDFWREIPFFKNISAEFPHWSADKSRDVTELRCLQKIVQRKRWPKERENQWK